MKTIRKFGLVLAAVVMTAGISAMIEGPAHADSSWGYAVIAPNR